MDFRLYLITDRRLVADLPGAIDRALAGIPRGTAAVLLREKDLGARALHELALACRAVCDRRGAKLFLSDRADVAIAAGAAGVHLTGGSIDPADVRTLSPRLLVGASCHTEAEIAARSDADFALYSPIFPSPGKGPAIGLDALRSAAACGLPLFALGGVDAANAAACIEAGAHGIAGIRGWLAAPDPAAATEQLLQTVLSATSAAFPQGGSPPPMTRPRTLC